MRMTTRSAPSWLPPQAPTRRPPSIVRVIRSAFRRCRRTADCASWRAGRARPCGRGSARSGGIGPWPCLFGVMCSQSMSQAAGQISWAAAERFEVLRRRRLRGFGPRGRLRPRDRRTAPEGVSVHVVDERFRELVGEVRVLIIVASLTAPRGGRMRRCTYDHEPCVASPRSGRRL